MRRPAQSHYRPPPLYKQLLEQMLGREQLMVRGAAHWPLLLLSFPRGKDEVAEEIRDGWLHTLPSLRDPVVEPYRQMLSLLPAMIVVLLRERNICTCLGHHHPKGTESRLTRRLSADIGGPVGEIDLSWQGIREWRPHPLSSLAATDDTAGFDRLHFRSALLTVLLHELEHLAHPDHQERAVRNASDTFYVRVLDELLREEGAGRYGMAPQMPVLPAG